MIHSVEMAARMAKNCEKLSLSVGEDVERKGWDRIPFRSSPG
jgi:hypothetical protein